MQSPKDKARTGNHTFGNVNKRQSLCFGTRFVNVTIKKLKDANGQAVANRAAGVGGGDGGGNVGDDGGNVGDGGDGDGGDAAGNEGEAGD